MLYVEPPFALGETLKGKDADNNLINTEILGKPFYFPHAVSTSKARPHGRGIVAVALRNVSGLTMLGKRVVKLSAIAGYDQITAFDGYAAGGVANGLHAILDPNLSSAGVVDDDIAWCIVRGPCLVLVPLAGADFNGDIALGAELVNSTGTTSGATTSGRLSNVVFTAATAGNTSNGFDGFKMAARLIGFALSAKTTAQTTAGQDILIEACCNLW